MERHDPPDGRDDPAGAAEGEADGLAEGADWDVQFTPFSLSAAKDPTWKREHDSGLLALELAKELRIPQFVFASSSSVYGVNPRVPWSESDFVLQPISPYASTKVSGELLGHVRAERLEVLGEVVGPDEGEDVRLESAEVRVVEDFDGGLLDGAVHPLRLAVRPGMVGLGEPVLDAVLAAAARSRELGA